MVHLVLIVYFSDDHVFFFCYLLLLKYSLKTKFNLNITLIYCTGKLLFLLFLRGKPGLRFFWFVRMLWLRQYNTLDGARMYRCWNNRYGGVLFNFVNVVGSTLLVYKTIFQNTIFFAKTLWMVTVVSTHIRFSRIWSPS